MNSRIWALSAACAVRTMRLAAQSPSEGAAPGASLDAALRGVQDLAHAGKLDKARDALAKLDARFGGLAAPRSVELADSLTAST
jgi:hypothetical protein